MASPLTVSLAGRIRHEKVQELEDEIAHVIIRCDPVAKLLVGCEFFELRELTAVEVFLRRKTISEIYPGMSARGGGQRGRGLNFYS